MIFRSARYIRGDLSLAVAELQRGDGRAPAADRPPRRRSRWCSSPTSTSATATCRSCSTSPSRCRKGEVLALLGTNGAGKSTDPKVITGLVTPERGVVRLNGRTITFTSPEQRAGLGIQMLPGGNGVFRSLSVRDNLASAPTATAVTARRRAPHRPTCSTCSRRSPPRRNARAGDLSGGQQQMLASAGSCCTNPSCSSSTSCRSGWPRRSCSSCSRSIEQLKAARPDDDHRRAVAERRRSRSPTGRCSWRRGGCGSRARPRELLERDDLARAVFLGAEGG